MRTPVRLVFLLLIGAVSGCGAQEVLIDVFTPAEFDLIKRLGPLTDPPADPTNRYADNAAAAAFGQRLFFEKSYSQAIVVGDDGSNGGLGAVGEQGKVSCASCHDPTHWYTDTRSKPGAVSLGVNYTERNSPPLVNAAYYAWNGWSGKQDPLWMQGAQGSESKVNFNSNRLIYVHVVFAKYRADYDALFPVPLDAALDPNAVDAARFPPSGRPKSSATAADGPWEMMASADRAIVNTIIVNCGKAIAAYERKLVSKNAPIDRYIGGDYGALNEQAKRGLKLFIGKAGCNACHDGTQLSDNDFHNTAVDQSLGAHAPATDEGRAPDLANLLASSFNGAGSYSDDPTTGAMKLANMMGGQEADRGRFRTKGLRNVAETGPYMHNGGLATLEDVVHFYNLGGHASGFAGTKDVLMVPLNLTDSEEADLVSFLKQGLTGEHPPASLAMDTSAP